MKSAFFRQIMIIVVTLLFTLSVLGGVLYLAFSGYLTEQKEASLTESSRAVETLARAYGSVGEMEDNWDFNMSLNLAAQVSGTDIVVCNEEGVVQVCACPDFACAHLGIHLPRELVAAAAQQKESYYEGIVSPLYEEERYVRLQMLTSDVTGEILGAVAVSQPVRALEDTSRGLLVIFLHTAILVLFLSAAASLLLSRYEARPLKAMAAAVRKFGHGDMKVRARNLPGSTREMEELVAAFNHMADTLERSERQRQEFVANVSHELKTPMTSISGYLDGMLDGVIPSEEHPKYMQLVSDEVRRMSRLVRSMLEISRMQSEGVDEKNLSRFDVGELMARTLVNFEWNVKEKHLEVDLDLPEKPLYTVAHRDGITQVLQNLMDNAVKFCNEGGSLAIRLSQEGGKLHLTVQNSGPTIPEEELPLIFDRFHKLDKSRSQDPMGVGLGLYIVKTIIGAHGENIWVESHDNRTAFTFTLPASK